MSTLNTAPHTHSDANEADLSLQRDQRLLVRLMDLYCRHRHARELRRPVALEDLEAESLVGRDLELCRECRTQLEHALIKRSQCPHARRPACRQCSQSCELPSFRTRIQKIMRYSDRRLLSSGKLDRLHGELF